MCKAYYVGGLFYQKVAVRDVGGLADQSVVMGCPGGRVLRGVIRG